MLRQIVEFVAVLACGLFAGAAVYVSFVEHPARMECGIEIATAQFPPSYRRGTIMQVTLAALGLLSSIAAWLAGATFWWLVAGVLLGSVIPFTLIVILPTNKQLLSPALGRRSAETERLLARWGRLHAARTVPRDGMKVSRRGGLDALHDLNLATPKTKTILFTAEVEAPEIVEAIQLGARGVLIKSAATQLLIESIRTVMAGSYWVGTHSVQNLVSYLQSQILEADRRKFGLTPREIEIVSVVAAGLSNKEIAQTLKIADDTVKHHMSNVFDKLGVSTRLELASFAFNQKLPLKDIV